MQVVKMFPYTEHRLRNENDLQRLIGDENEDAENYDDDDDESLDIEEGDSSSTNSSKTRKSHARIRISNPNRSNKQAVVCQTLLRSRLVWLIIILSIVLIIICYENYIENMRQFRLQDYIKQTGDLENKLKGMDADLGLARGKLQELMKSKMKEKSL